MKELEFTEFEKRYKRTLEKFGFKSNLSQEQLVEIFVAHYVIREWEIEENEERKKKDLGAGL